MQQEYPIPQAYRNRQYLQNIETDSPVLRAAADVAIAGHEGQPRGKADASLPYIVHPIMVYNLLKAMGETDEIMLAAALLHDVKEDNKTFRQDHGAFIKALEDALKEHGVTDTREIAQEIGDLCTELTNPDKMNEGKRLYQVEHAGRLSLRGTKVKLLDQTASVLDFIMQENEPGFTHDQVASWNLKALNLVKEIAKKSQPLGPWRNLHKALFSYAMRIVDSESSEQAETIRREFNWDKAVEAAHNMPESKDVALAATVVSPSVNHIVKGITAIDLGENGQVIGYSCLAAPGEAREALRNTVAINLLGNLECSKSTRRVTPSEPVVEHGRLVRHYKVKPPLEAGQFFDIAKKSDAMGFVFNTALREKVQEIAPQEQQRSA